MVTEGRTPSSALLRNHIGLALFWIGVLTWLPFILLRASGYKPSLFWFLPLHLVGVIGGSRLRKMAREEIGAEAPQKNAFRTIGHGLIFLEPVMHF